MHKRNAFRKTVISDLSETLAIAQRDCPKLVGVIYFGSFSRGKKSPADLDLVLLFGPNTTKSDLRRGITLFLRNNKTGLNIEQNSIQTVANAVSKNNLVSKLVNMEFSTGIYRSPRPSFKSWQIVSTDYRLRQLYEQILFALDSAGRKAILKRMDAFHSMNPEKFRQEIQALKAQIANRIK